MRRFRDIAERFRAELQRQRPDISWEFCVSGAIGFDVEIPKHPEIAAIWMTPDWNDVGLIPVQFNGQDGDVLDTPVFKDRPFMIPSGQSVKAIVRRYLKICDEVVQELSK